MPTSKEYQILYKALGERFHLPGLENLQTAILIDILAALEKPTEDLRVVARKPRQSKPRQ